MIITREECLEFGLECLEFGPVQSRLFFKGVHVKRAWIVVSHLKLRSSDVEEVVTFFEDFVLYTLADGPGILAQKLKEYVVPGAI